MWTTSSCPACCMRWCCAVPMPTRASAPSTGAPRWRCRVCTRSSRSPICRRPCSGRPCRSWCRARPSSRHSCLTVSPRMRPVSSASRSPSLCPTAAIWPRTRPRWSSSLSSRCRRFRLCRGRRRGAALLGRLQSRRRHPVNVGNADAASRRPRIFREKIFQHAVGRSSGMPRMIAVPDPMAEALTIYVSARPAPAQAGAADLLTGLTPLRIVTPDVGGGFGPKGSFAEYGAPAAAGAAPPDQMDRDRQENFLQPSRNATALGHGDRGRPRGCILGARNAHP